MREPEPIPLLVAGPLCPLPFLLFSAGTSEGTETAEDPPPHVSFSDKAWDPHIPIQLACPTRSTELAMAALSVRQQWVQAGAGTIKADGSEGALVSW